ncbi:MAG: hypothetical protein A3J79_00110 [Elusimicrobia bacterium RIFOXYB2_FULL_62_6]|nr:MAG: hypothetical protein A3J79_00110 [Elusimicrobia bacterium RIFOXYB2_FULL_62_6]
MKKIFPALALLCSFALAPAFGAEDCSRSGDACKQPAKAATPFMAEVKKAAAEAPELRQGKPAEPELKQGRSKDPELKPAPVQAPAAAPEAAAPAVPADKETLSKPAWLLLVFALLAGLYYYLREGKKRGKKN